ncbi:MAG: SpoIIE family protein phosphatase [Lentisphaerae bacterium]|nr:SpoIIE family protein phosphatase [Lentisphaerota bacterium]
MISAQSVPAIVLASITLYTGIYHLLLSSRRRRHRTDLTFALTCIAMGGYDVFCAGLYSGAHVAEGMMWQRAQLLALALVGMAFVWFCSDYTGAVSRRFRWLSTAFFSGMALMMMLAPNALIFQPNRGILRSFRFLGTAVSYHEAELSRLTMLQHGGAILAFIYLLIVGFRFYQRERRQRAVPLLAAMVCFFIGAVNDTAVATGLNHSIYILEYAYMGMVFLMAFRLSDDVAEMASTRASLIEMETRFRAIFRNTAVGLALTDCDGRIVQSNPGLCQMFGCSSEALADSRLFDHFHASDRSSLQRMVDRILAGEGTSFRSEKRYIWPDKSIYWGDISISTVHPVDDDTKIEGLIWIVVGISERRHAVDSLRALNEKLEEQVVERTRTLILTNRRLVDSLQKLHDDEEAGKLIQTSLLPPQIDQLGPLRFSRHLVPSFYMSGDFVDYFQIDDQHVGFYMADVSGHGVSSALITVLLKSFVSYTRERFVREGDQAILDPGLLLTRLNKELLTQNLGKHMTLFYGVIEIERNHLTFANGGQFPFPIILTEGVAQQIKIKGVPLGMFDFSTYENCEYPLPERFVIAFFSDGVLDLLEQPGLTEKQACLREAVARSAGALVRMTKHLGLAEVTMPPDDVSVLTVQRG